MKVDDLMEIGEGKELLIIAGGRLQPVTQAIESADGKHLLLVGNADPKPYARYSKEDEGFIIRAIAYGMPVEDVARMIGKTKKSLLQKMKSMRIESF